MERKGKSKTTWWIWVSILVLLAAALTGYLVMRQEDQETPSPEETARPAQERTETGAVERKDLPPPSTAAPGAEKSGETPFTGPDEPVEEEAGGDEEEKQAPAPGEEEVPCEEIQARVRDFFDYLDRKEYVDQVLLEKDTWEVFKSALSKLSARPPIPAGEGLDPVVLTRNVYHFFRVLSGREIQLAKDVLRHESDTLEFNLEMFYQWLTQEDRCADPEEIRPSREVMYRYAGFFLNTIGGRSYLFRRATEARLLVTYYSLLILYEADKEGRNQEGIDIYPFVKRTKEEIASHQGLHFKEAYLEKLSEMEAYYMARR